MSEVIPTSKRNIWKERFIASSENALMVIEKNSKKNLRKKLKVTNRKH